MYPELTRYLDGIVSDTARIPEPRKKVLGEIAAYVRKKKQQNDTASITFICTHNSRRSHMSQLWAITAAAHLGVAANLQTFSGGTEATAFNPRSVATMERAGFRIQKPEGDNPRYIVQYGDEAPEQICFSKKFDDPENPQSQFAAVMTCSEADKNCPFVPGAEARMALPYEDPKIADNTPQEQQRYDERSRQIATEMLYLARMIRDSK